MKLAHKILNRLRREIRHDAAFTKSRWSRKKGSAEDLSDAWESSTPRLTANQCVQEWIESRPVLFHEDMKIPLNALYVCEEADDILKGKLTILGGVCSSRMPHLWHEDPLTHKPWPSLIHFTQFNVFHPLKDGRTDIRRLWEVGRFGWALPLARTFLIQNDLKYVKAWSDYARSFIENNPPEFGPHWLNAMEVGIRAIQWCRALAIFLSRKNSSKMLSDSEDSPLSLILSSLLAHGRYIRSHLEWTSHGRTNHYLSNLVGLLVISTFVPQFRESKKWRAFARKELVREIKIQTNSDGLHAEASTAYHHFALELYALVTAVDRQHRLHLSPSFHKKVLQMRDADVVLRGVANLDPRIGDDDSGTLFISDSLVKTPERGSRNSLSMLGRRSASHAFRQSGIFILRSKTLSCHVACGPNGQQGVGGHAHNDKLSIVVRCQGVPIIVDPGTFCYSSDIKARDLYRSTKMHNTVMIDGEEQNPLEDWRKLKDQTKARCLIWKDSANEILFLGEHLGYKKNGVVHRRAIQFDKLAGKFLFLDEIDASGKHVMDFYLHFAPWLTRQKIRIEDREVSLPAAKIIFRENVEMEIIDTSCSPVYGQQVPSLALHLKHSFSGKLAFRWEFHEILSNEVRQ